MTLQQFIAKYDGKKIDLFMFRLKPSFSRVKLFVSGLVSNFWVKFRVCFSVCQNKVFQPIVRMVAVFMMNYLKRLKFSTKFFLQYLSVAFTLPIRMMRNIAIYVFSMTTSRAKKIPAFPSPTFIPFKRLATPFTNKNTESGKVIAVSTTKSSLLTGWGVERFVAIFTNILHITNYSTQCV